MVHVDIIRCGFSMDCDPELGKIAGIRNQALSSDQLRLSSTSC